MRAHPLLVTCSIVAVAACGGGSDPGPSFQCDDVPACYTDAVAALRACVPTPALTLVPVTPTSGVVDGLTCTSAELEVAFSAFSESLSGTVPLPSGVTLTSSGGFCAELGSGTGTHTDGSGNVLQFELSTLRVASADELAVLRYEDGSIGVNCSPPGTTEEVTAPAGALDSCPDAVLFHEVVRNADITEIGVDLVDAIGGRATLFSCN